MNPNLKLAVTVGSYILTAVASASVGYFAARRRLTSAYLDMLDDEIEKTKQHYAALYKKEGYESPQEAAASLGVDVANTVQQNLTNYGAKAAEAKKLLVDLQQGRTFDKEMEVRNKANPYIISVAEFMAGDRNYSQVTLSYFEGDDTLMDDKDDIISNPAEVIGVDTLQFGKFSDDDNIVYIRNDKLEADYEVTRSRGKYSVEVAGLEEEPEEVIPPSRIDRFRRR